MGIMSLPFYCRYLKTSASEAVKAKSPKFLDYITSVTINFEKLNSICERTYDIYDKININNIDLLKTLVQFEKYQYEKQAQGIEVYSALDACYKGSDKEISRIDICIFNDPLLCEEDMFTFSLCEEQSTKIEL